MKNVRVTVTDGNVVRALTAPIFANHVNLVMPNPQMASRLWTASPLTVQIETMLQVTEMKRKQLLKM